MGTKIGFKTYVGLGMESSLGTFAAPTSFIEFNSESFQKSKEERVIESIHGTAQYTKRVTLNESVSGSLEFPLVPSSALKFLKFVGSISAATTLTVGVYQYSVKARLSNLADSASFQVCRDTADTSASVNYTGCKLNNITFAVNAGDLLNVSADFIGADGVYANTISTASYLSYNPYTFVNAVVSIGNSISVATTTAVKSWQLSIANNLIEDRDLGNARAALITESMQDITYEISARFVDNSLFDRFLNNTPTYIKAVFSGPSITAIYNHQITFESYKTFFNGSVGNIGSAADLINATYPMRAIDNQDTHGSLYITVITDTASI